MSDIDTRVQELLVRISNDKQAASATIAALKAVENAQNDLTEAQDNGDGSAAIAAIRAQSDAQFKLAEAIDDVTQATKKATQAASDFNVEALRTDTLKALNSASNQVQSGSGGGGSTSFGGIARTGSQLLGAAGIDAGPLRAVGEVSRLVDEFGGSVADVGKAAAITSPLLIAAGIAIKLYSDQTKAEENAIQGAIAAHEAYVTAIHKFTTDQIKDQIQQLETNRAILTQERDDTVRALQNTDFSQGFLLPLSKSFTDLMGKAGDYNKQLGDNQTQIDALKSALGTTEVATNDATAAEKALADARTQTTLASAQTSGKNFLQNQQLLRGSVDQVNSALQALSDQMGANAAEINTLVTSGDQSAEVQARIKQLLGENNDAEAQRADILANVLPIVQAAADAEFQLNAARQKTLVLSQEMVDAEKAYQTASDNLTKAQQAASDGAAKAAATLQQAFDSAASTLQAAITSANAEAAQAQENAEYKKNEDLQNARDKAAADEAKALDDFNQKKKEIERQFQYDATNAVRNRDAVAFTNAKETRDKDLRNAKDAYRAQLKSIQDGLKAEQKRIEQAYKDQLRTIDQQLQKQLAAAQAAYDKQTAAAQQAYDTQVASLQANLANLQSIRDAAYQAELTAVQNFNNQLVASANGLSTNNAVTNINAGIGTATQGLTPSLSGAGQAYSVFNRPSRLNTSQQIAASGANNSFQFTINGGTMRQIKRQINRQLDSFASGAGRQYGFGG